MSNNDLISREALKEKLKERYYNGGLDIVTAIELIDNAPTVKFSLLPADESKDEAYMRGYNHGFTEGILKARTRRKGEWLYNDKLNMFYCKDCGLLEPLTKEEIEEGCKLPNFCQQGGADMRNTANPTKEVIDKLGECKCNTCKHNGTWACNNCHCFDKYEGGAV